MVERHINDGGSRNSKGNKRRKKRFFKLKWLMYLFAMALLLAAVGYMVFEQQTHRFRERAEIYDLDEIDDVEIKSLILDRKGRELGRIFVENRDKISIDDVPEVMINALVAGEDQRFFKHDGIDRIGVLRALYLNLKAGRQTQGASTLTQQLARNAFHLKQEAQKRGEGGLERKAVEAYLALRIEKKYSKRQILEFYLNRIPFGSGFYGIRSASLGYFGKEPRDLSAMECASLVGCIKNPTRISPLNNLAENKKARDQVLQRMVDEGFISSKEGRIYIDTPVVVNPKPIRRGTSHLYERIAGEVRSHLGEDALTEGGYKIHTTIDLDVQRAMEKSLLRQLATAEAHEHYDQPLYESYRKKDGKPRYLQGAGYMIDNDSGAVLAYAGGRNFSHSQYDFVQSGSKPAGTAFFPFIYTAALENAVSPAARLIDRPMDNRAVMVDGREGILGEWGMETMKPKYEGEISMRRALEVSKIAATVRLGKEVGLSGVATVARKFGLSVPETKLLTRMLVGTDDVSLPQMVNAYATISRSGLAPKPAFFIDRVVGPKGIVRYKVSEPTDASEKRVISNETAYIMHNMLQSALAHGTGEPGIAELKSDPSFAGKTGTTYDFADNWFVGYNSRVTCGLWMGFWHGKRDAIYPGAFSRQTLLPVWVKAMNAALPDFAGEEIQQPASVFRLDVCSESGLRATRYCQRYQRDVLTGAESYQSTAVGELFTKQSQPVGYCDVHGVVDPLAAGYHNLNSSDQQTSSSHAIPIQPRQPLLLGSDPYRTEQPDFAPRQSLSAATAGIVINFDQLDDKDRRAGIILDRPGRIEIVED
ncbi:MAG: transglycosylase domain-containing protein [Akkermansiaceae bacterium]